MEISNPRRILAVSLVESAECLSRVIKDLTGTHPSPSTTASSSSSTDDSSQTLAGTTHHLSLTTAYYSATVPIWLDLIASPEEWAQTFLSPEAKEVLEVLGGVVVVFPLVSEGAAAATKELVKHVGSVVREGLGGWEWDGVGLAVGVSTGGTSGEEMDEVLDEWEDLCAELGLEFVHYHQLTKEKEKGGEKKGEKNEFGERMGIERVLEALQANDWSGAGAEDGSEEEEDEFGAMESGGPAATRRVGNDDGELDPESLGFGFDREDFVRLRKAIWTRSAEHEDEQEKENGKMIAGKAGGQGEGPEGDEEEDEKLGDDEIRKLEGMMRKLQAVRDMTAGMPDEQRRRMAKQAVDEVMKEL
ncbi:alpha and gamma adaptin binding protein p34 [Apodospora peruviana]|uniref:Alpha and gamma adaptin binding protein p34 n=1 Tax=Apodospora peruviana TaxID=516989 RepID=A0AAE0MBZ6_9PEZI|nr:alpha and gamma adaptin binding protein p34 [Apodospora peruviana]